MFKNQSQLTLTYVGLGCLAVVGLAMSLVAFIGLAINFYMNQNGYIVVQRDAFVTPVVTLISEQSGTTFVRWQPIDVIAAFRSHGLETESYHLMTADDYGAAPMVAIDAIRFYIPSLCEDCGGRIFSFDNPNDMETMHEYYVSLSRSSAWFYSHLLTRDNILVQINGDLPEERRIRYQQALDSLTTQTKLPVAQQPTGPVASPTPQPPPTLPPVPTNTVLMPTATDVPTVTPIPTLAPTVASTATSTPFPTPDPLSFEVICTKDKSMTDVQIDAYLDSFIGTRIGPWRGWVYEVHGDVNNYQLRVSMSPPDFWQGWDIIIYDIPTDQALRLQKEQPISFTGTVRKIDRGLFGGICNPFKVENAVIAEE